MRIEVMHYALMTTLQQAACHISTHSPQSNHTNLHRLHFLEVGEFRGSARDGVPATHKPVTKMKLDVIDRKLGTPHFYDRSFTTFPCQPYNHPDHQYGNSYCYPIASIPYHHAVLPTVVIHHSAYLSWTVTDVRKK
jgi:hypothetical protein